MGLLNKINRYVSRFLSSYLSTRVIFIFDMIMSLIASLVMLAVIDIFLYAGSFHWKLICYWMGLSFVFSFIFIWRIRTYRIIVRHMTLKEMSLFALVAFSKVAAIAIVFGLTFRFNPLLYFMTVADFFFTFGMFFLLRLAMLYAYNVIKARKEFRESVQNVLVYGIGVKSVSLLSRFANSSRHNIVGFIQFGDIHATHVISEKKVNYVCTEEQFQRVITRTGTQAILFATEEEAREEKDRIIRYIIIYRYIRYI